MTTFNTVEEFNTLPQEVKDKVLHTMGAWSEVKVRREYGEYKVEVDSFLSRTYARDHKIWWFNNEELKKQYAKEIEAQEKRYYDECKDCNWDAY